MQCALQAQLNHFVRISAIGPQNRLHAPIQLHHAHALFQAGHRHNLGPGLIFSNHARRKAGLGDGQNSVSANFRRDLHCSVANRIGRMNALGQALLLEQLNIVQGFLRALSNLSHSLHCFQGIFTGSSFAAKHNDIGTIENGVGHVTRLGTRCTIAIHHALQHLGSGDNGLACLIAAGNNLLLHDGHILGGNFHTQVATRYHHTIGHINNLINIFYTGFIFNLRNDAHVIAIFL